MASFTLELAFHLKIQPLSSEMMRFKPPYTVKSRSCPGISSSGGIREFPFSNRLLGLHFDPKFSFGPPGLIGLRSKIKLLFVPIDLSAKKILVD